MGCVRNRGKSWNAHVRVSGWRSFTKIFAKKSDAVKWMSELERKLYTAPIPNASIQSKISLADILLKYAKEVLSLGR